MKKGLLAAGLALIITAVICFGVSLFFDHLGGSVMDASNDFYHRAYERYLFFRNCGIGLAVFGALCLLVRFLKFRQ